MGQNYAKESNKVHLDVDNQADLELPVQICDTEQDDQNCDNYLCNPDSKALLECFHRRKLVSKENCLL